MFEQIRRRVFLVLIVGLVSRPTEAQTPRVPGSPAQAQESARESWQKVPDILEAMAVRPGASVADVGAGGGFLTVRLARAVGPTGRVTAVDISAAELERLRARLDREGLTNVDTVTGDADNPHLPIGSLDAAVIVNAYHEMADYQAMLRHLRRALKPDGRLVIIEPISEKRRAASRDQQVAVHEIAVSFVEQEAPDAGFRIQRLQDPFTTHTDAIEWLLVGVPDPLAPALGAMCPLPPKTSASPTPSATDDETAIANPDLRMAFDTFKTRLGEGALVVVDVRSEEEFLAGHVPGAIWIPLSTVATQVSQLRARGLYRRANHGTVRLLRGHVEREDRATLRCDRRQSVSHPQYLRMACCCSSVGAAVDGHFSQKRAAADLADYREHGPASTTRLLLAGLVNAGRLRGRLLDIGSGIGALTFELLERGLTRAVGVKASRTLCRRGLGRTRCPLRSSRRQPRRARHRIFEIKSTSSCDDRGHYSQRRAIVGSTRMARCAGLQVAASAATDSSSATPM